MAAEDLAEMDLQSIRQAAREGAAAGAADAMRTTMLKLGIDIEDGRQIAETREDFAHLRRWRKGFDTAANRGFGAAVAAFVGGLVTFGWVWFRSHFPPGAH